MVVHVGIVQILPAAGEVIGAQHHDLDGRGVGGQGAGYLGAGRRAGLRGGEHAGGDEKCQHGVILLKKNAVLQQ